MKANYNANMYLTPSDLNEVEIEISNKTKEIQEKIYKIESPLRNIKLGDDLSGKLLVLSFPRNSYELFNGNKTLVSSPNYEIRYIFDSNNNRYRIDLYNDNDKRSYFLYARNGSNDNPYLNYVRYRLPDDFGTVYYIDSSDTLFKYIQIYEDESVIPDYELKNWESNEFIYMQDIDRIEQGIENIGKYYNKPLGWITTKEWFGIGEIGKRIDYGIETKSLSYQDINRWITDLNLTEVESDVTLWNTLLTQYYWLVIKEFLKLTIFGKSEQETRSGKNLFDGITESGGYNNTTGEKTTSTALLRNANPIYVKPNTNYQISNNGTEVLMNVLEYRSDGTFIQHYQDKVGSYITTSNEVSYINIYRGTTEFDKVQIEEGTVVTEYEEPGASPSPDYPSEIKTVKGIRNLFKVTDDTYSTSNITYTKLTDNSLRISATRDTEATWSGYVEVPINIEEVKPNTTYTFSKTHKIDGITFNMIGSIRTKINGTYNTIYNKDILTFTTPEDLQSLSLVFYIAYADAQTGSCTIDFEDIQLEEGSIQHSPVPYGPWLEVKDTGKNLATNFGTLWYRDVTSPPEFTNNTNFRSCTAKVKPNSKITISKKNNSNRFVVITSEEPIDVGIPYKRLVLREGNDSTRLEYTFETQDNENYIMFGFYNGTDENEIITASEEIQIEVNDKKTEYEPYKEHSTLIDMNKPNLFDKDNANILNGYINASKQFGENTAGDKSLYIKCKPNTKYSIRKIASNVGRVVSFERIPVNKDIGIDIVDLTSSKQFGTIKTSSNVNYLGFFYKSVNDTLTEQEILDSIKIYEGVGTDDYYELCSIGDTKDTFTIQNKQATINQRIGKVVLDGSESWILKTSTIDDTYLYEIQLNDSYVKDTMTISYMSDCFTSYTSADLWYNPYIGISINNSKQLRIRTNISTVAEFKTWLSENPVTVYYILEEPQTITLNGTYDVELFDGVNNISTNDELEPNLEITLKNNKTEVDEVYEGSSLTFEFEE